MGSFSSAIIAFAAKTQIAGETVLKKVAFEGLLGVVMMSPVDTGRFRGSWRVSLNKVDLTSLSAAGQSGKKFKGENTQRATGVALAAGRVGIESAKWGNAIYISNSLPYGRFLEDGSSKQAPHGMLKVTFERILRSANKAVAAAKSGQQGI